MINQTICAKWIKKLIRTRSKILNYLRESTCSDYVLMLKGVQFSPNYGIPYFSANREI